VRLSTSLIKTLREAPADVLQTGRQWLVRAGMMRALGPHQWAMLPPGMRIVKRLERLILERIALIPPQEVCLPPGVPLPGGWLVLAGRTLESYRDLPRLITGRGYGPEGDPALLACLLGPGDEDHQAQHAQIGEGVLHTLRACGMEARALEDVGRVIFAAPDPAGDLRTLACPACGYAATARGARFAHKAAPPDPELALQKVATPDCKTIEALAQFLGVEASQTLKAVFYTASTASGSSRSVLVMLRGDLGVSEAKLLHVLGVERIEPASEEAIRAGGAEPGYASPIGLKVADAPGGKGLLVVGDLSLEGMGGFATGANEAAYHYVHARYPRDFRVSLLADVAQAEAGMPCPHCEASLQAGRALALGESEMITSGDRYGEASYLAADGRPAPVYASTQRIDVGQTLAALAAAQHDEHGLCWPEALAPFDVHVVALKGEGTLEASETLYRELEGQGLAVLYDDRLLSPGVMFADADLIGAPLRVTASARSLEAGGFELKWRRESARSILGVEGAAEAICEMLAGHG